MDLLSKDAEIFNGDMHKNLLSFDELNIFVSRSTPLFKRTVFSLKRSLVCIGVLTLKAPRKILEQTTIYFCFLFFRENNAWHYIWIVCQAGDSHVMSSIISSENYVEHALKISSASRDWRFKDCSAVILCPALGKNLADNFCLLHGSHVKTEFPFIILQDHEDVALLILDKLEDNNVINQANVDLKMWVTLILIVGKVCKSICISHWYHLYIHFHVKSFFCCCCL